MWDGDATAWLLPFPRARISPLSCFPQPKGDRWKYARYLQAPGQIGVCQDPRGGKGMDGEKAGWQSENSRKFFKK